MINIRYNIIIIMSWMTVLVIIVTVQYIHSSYQHLKVATRILEPELNIITIYTCSAFSASKQS